MVKLYTEASARQSTGFKGTGDWSNNRQMAINHCRAVNLRGFIHKASITLIHSWNIIFENHSVRPESRSKFNSSQLANIKKYIPDTPLP